MKRNIFPEHDRVKGDKASQKNKDRKEPRIKEVHVHKNSGNYSHSNSDRGKILIPEFFEWIKEQPEYEGLERHHFYGGAMGGRMDCFVICISPSLHQKIHQGAEDSGVKAFINSSGEENLIMQSMTMLLQWVNSPLTDYRLSSHFSRLAVAIIADIENAVETAKEFHENNKSSLHF